MDISVCLMNHSPFSNRFTPSLKVRPANTHSQPIQSAFCLTKRNKKNGPEKGTKKTALKRITRSRAVFLGLVSRRDVLVYILDTLPVSWLCCQYLEYLVKNSYCSGRKAKRFERFESRHTFLIFTFIHSRLCILILRWASPGSRISGCFQRYHKRGHAAAAVDPDFSMMTFHNAFSDCQA